MLEDLETDTDDNMIDMTGFFDRPQNEKRSPRPALNCVYKAQLQDKIS